MNPGKSPTCLAKVSANLDAVSGNLRLFNPSEFEKWLEKSFSDTTGSSFSVKNLYPNPKKSISQCFLKNVSMVTQLMLYFESRIMESDILEWTLPMNTPLCHSVTSFHHFAIFLCLSVSLSLCHFFSPFRHFFFPKMFVMFFIKIFYVILSNELFIWNIH